MVDLNTVEKIGKSPKKKKIGKNGKFEQNLSRSIFTFEFCPKIL